VSSQLSAIGYEQSLQDTSGRDSFLSLYIIPVIGHCVSFVSIRGIYLFPGLIRREDDFRVEERARYAGRYGDQFPLAVEDFDLAGAGEFGEVDGAAAADARGCRFVGGYGRQMRQELAGVDEEGGYAFVVGNSRFLWG
jgi:hypothetical protein